jgi:hypothetical protein
MFMQTLGETEKTAFQKQLAAVDSVLGPKPPDLVVKSGQSLVIDRSATFRTIVVEKGAKLNALPGTTITVIEGGSVDVKGEMQVHNLENYGTMRLG